jgi:hypothetical protein
MLCSFVLNLTVQNVTILAQDAEKHILMSKTAVLCYVLAFVLVLSC